MGRPRNPAAPRAVRPARAPEGTRPIVVALGPADVALADAVAAELARHTGAVPSRTRAIRWSIRELHARLRLARDLADHHVTPVYVKPGPMVDPPD